MTAWLPHSNYSGHSDIPKTGVVQFKRALSAVAILFMLVALPLRASLTVNLSPSTSPTAGQAGITNINVTGSDFPAGIISPSGVILTLEAAGSGAPDVTAIANSVTTITGSVRRITFRIPSSILVSAPTTYQVSIAGTTSTGIGFASGNSSALTVNPPSSIGGIAPSTGQQGQSISVTITGLFTNFVQGATEASFGPEISVGAAAAGQSGPVTVTSATSAIAQLQISAVAGPGPVTVTVTTGAQQASSSFTITSAAACTPPQVVSFDATVTNLSAAGQTTLGWITTGDSVEITPGPSQLAPSDQLTVNTNLTTTYTVQTTNACGSASQQLTIGVGAPFIRSISPASATPGQEITLTLGNVGGPVGSALNSVVFSFPDELPVHGHVERVLQNGNVIVTVPIALTDAVPLGYVTGSADISAQLFNVLTPEVPFTIMPLVFSGDAGSEFSGFISNLAQSTQSNFSQLGSLPDDAGAVSVLQPLVNSYLSVFSKMVKDISTTGSATVPVDIPSAAFPNPQTATVTRQDLETFLALYQQFSSQPTQVQAQANASRIQSLKAPTGGQGPFCLQDGTPSGIEYGVCRAIIGNPTNQQVVNFGKLVSDLVSNVNPLLCLVPTHQPLPLNVIGDFFTKIVDAQTFLCNVAPVSLGVGSNNFGPDGFVHGADGAFIVQNPPPPPTSPFPLGSGQLDAIATLTGLLDPNEAGEEIKNELISDAVDFLADEALTPQCVAAVTNQLQNIFPQYQASLSAALQKIGLTNARSRTVQATNCDLDHLDSADKKIIEHTGPDSGGVSYGFKGNEVGVTDATIFPIKGDTLFTDISLGFTKGRLAIDNISREYFAPVIVANPPTLTLGSFIMQAGNATKSFPDRTVSIGQTLDNLVVDSGYSAEIKAEYFVNGGSTIKWIITQKIHGPPNPIISIFANATIGIYSVNTNGVPRKIKITVSYSWNVPGDCLSGDATIRATAADPKNSVLNATITDNTAPCSGPQNVQNQLVGTAVDETTQLIGQIAVLSDGSNFDATVTTTIELD